MTCEDLNEVIKRSLVAFQEAQQALVFLLTTILNLIFEKPFWTPPDIINIICDIKTDEKLFTLANIYAPNEDNAPFFKKSF